MQSPLRGRGWSIVHSNRLAQAQRGSGSGPIRVAASDGGKKDLSWDCGQSYLQGPGDPFHLVLVAIFCGWDSSESVINSH